MCFTVNYAKGNEFMYKKETKSVCLMCLTKMSIFMKFNKKLSYD